MAATTGYPQPPQRPRPQVPGVPNPRTPVVKDMKRQERRRYSTNLSDAAARAAVEKL